MRASLAYFADRLVSRVTQQ